MRFLGIFLLFICSSSEAEIGIDVGFRFVCNPPEGLTLTSYVGSPDLAQTDYTIVMERATKSCRVETAFRACRKISLSLGESILGLI